MEFAELPEPDPERLAELVSLLRKLQASEESIEGLCEELRRLNRVNPVLYALAVAACIAIVREILHQIQLLTIDFQTYLHNLFSGPLPANWREQWHAYLAELPSLNFVVEPDSARQFEDGIESFARALGLLPVEPTEGPPAGPTTDGRIAGDSQELRGALPLIDPHAAAEGLRLGAADPSIAQRQRDTSAVAAASARSTNERAADSDSGKVAASSPARGAQSHVVVGSQVNELAQKEADAVHRATADVEKHSTTGATKPTDLPACSPLAAESTQQGGIAKRGLPERSLSLIASQDSEAVPQTAGVQVNKAAGDAVRDLIATREHPARTEQVFDTVGGVRRVDVLKLDDELVAIESKVGRTSLTERTRQELARD